VPEKDLQRCVWNILGLPFDGVTLSEAVVQVAGGVGASARLFLTTPNLNFVIATQSDDAFFHSVVDSDLSIADGMPLIWVAKLLGIPITERVAGSTLFDELSQQKHQAEKIKVFFFGGQDGVAELAHLRLNETSLGMVSRGFYDPGFVSIDAMSSEAIINTINAAKADFIVVALGAKKGQDWIQKNREQLTAPVISHLGAVINFVAGNVVRAPLVWQRFGFEWLWRIRQEPTLWKRYLFDGFAFVKLMMFNVMPLAIYDRVLKRSSCFTVPCEIEVFAPLKRVIHLSGSFPHNMMFGVKSCFSSIVDEEQGDVMIDCSKLEYIDGAFIATLLLFQRYLNKQQRLLVLKSVSLRIVRVLRFNAVLQRFDIA